MTQVRIIVKERHPWNGDPAGRLDRVTSAAHVVDERHDQRLRGSSSPAKKTVAARRISLSSRSRLFSARNRLVPACSALLAPGGAPASTSAWTSQRRTVSRPTPNLPATALANAVSDGYTLPWAR